MARVKKLTSPDSGSEDKVYGSDWNDLVDDYLSQTDTATQALASDVTMAAGKKIDGLDPSDVPSPASSLCRIKTGQYTGDGTISQAITGVGFQPKWVWISKDVTAQGTDTNEPTFFKSDQMSGEMAWSSVTAFYDNRLISLDADGFTVDDDGADEHPNKNGQGYVYMALG